MDAWGADFYADPAGVFMPVSPDGALVDANMPGQAYHTAITSPDTPNRSPSPEQLVVGLGPRRYRSPADREDHRLARLQGTTPPPPQDQQAGSPPPVSDNSYENQVEFMV